MNRYGQGGAVKHFKGFCELITPRDLVLKLEYDLERIKQFPQDQYAAFDFFITAEHIIDWLHPSDKKAREKIRSSSSLLRITSHIANGAKHFEATSSHHRSVADIEKCWPVAEPGCFEKGVVEEPLIVHLTHDEAQSMVGKEIIEVDQLARDVLEYWKANAT